MLSRSQQAELISISVSTPSEFGFIGVTVTFVPPTIPLNSKSLIVPSTYTCVFELIFFAPPPLINISLTEPAEVILLAISTVTLFLPAS